MSAMSGLLSELQAHSIGHNRNILHIYGDPAYPLTLKLMTPFKGAHVTELQHK